MPSAFFMAHSTSELPSNIQQAYDSIHLIAKGAFAQIYRGIPKEQKDARPVILRYFPQVLSPFRMQRELDLLKTLNHFDRFFIPLISQQRLSEGGLLQVFPYRGSLNLTARILKSGPLGDDDAKLLLRRLVLSLKIVHRLGFVHGDIHPANILADKAGYFLLDWSQAIPAKKHYESERLVCNKAYLPPENLQGQFDSRGDVYSLGMTLYFTLSGQHWIKSQEAPHAYLLALQRSWEDLELLSDFWRPLIAWMTAYDPQERPTLDQILAYLKGSPDRKDEVLQPYFQGNIPGDKQQAYQQLKELGYAYGTFKSAVYLKESGEFAQAEALYKGLVAQNYTRAMNNLADLWISQNMESHYKKAIELLYRAFRLQNPYAAYNLARLYEQGKILKKAPHKARAYYYFAAIRGHLGATQALKRL